MVQMTLIKKSFPIPNRAATARGGKKKPQMKTTPVHP
jgi:hypothetical protein